MESSQKLIAIHILEILNRYADENCRIGQLEIMQHLLEDYGESITRHTCSDYLKKLREGGYIAGQRGVYKVGQFSEQELRILIGSVVCNQKLTAEEAHVLLEKLRNESYHIMNSKLRNLYFHSLETDFGYEQARQIFDVVDDAISNHLRIEIEMRQRNERNVGQAKHIIVDPYFIVNEYSQYYLLCYSLPEGFHPVRLSEIATVQQLDETSFPLEMVAGKNFDIKEYMRTHTFMSEGGAELAEIQVPSNCRFFFEDTFGSNYTVKDDDGENCILEAHVNKTALLRWGVFFADTVEIIKPESVRQMIRDRLKLLGSKYNR